MDECSYRPPLLLNTGLAMTLHMAFVAPRNWQNPQNLPEIFWQNQIFLGEQDVPIFAQFAVPKNPRGTIIGTYGITGDLNNQWILKIFAAKAFAQDYAVVIFDWRAHGKTAQLSPTLTSDGLYEGKDFVKIAVQAKQIGCPPPFWLTGYSLGGQLALWGIKESTELDSEIAGGAVICPSLDAERSLAYLESSFWGRAIDRAIAKSLKALALDLYNYHPQDIDLKAIQRAHSIRTFDQELVIPRLGLTSTSEYYELSSPLPFLEKLGKPTLIIYAADDPMFEPSLVPELREIAQNNQQLKLILTAHGGHVGYLSSSACQTQAQDPDPWWAWNRVLEWFASF